MSQPNSKAPSLSDQDLGQLIVANAREYAIITIGEDGLIAGWSPGAERLFGYAPEEVVGTPMKRLFLPSDVAAGAHQLELETADQSGRAEDSRWHVRSNGEKFWGNGVTMAIRESDRRGYLKIVRDETRSKLADEQRVLLLNELNHRLKNTLSTVQSIAEQTLRAAKVSPGVRSDLTNRLMALSHAHDLLVSENWAGAELRDVVEKAIAPHYSDARFSLDGPPLRLSPHEAVSVSLAIHELATNAIKHGALSAPGGKIAIAWNVSQDGEGRRYMTLLWTESGGPPTKAPSDVGFGTRLIARTFGQENGGRAKLDFRLTGLECMLELPLGVSGETPILNVEAARARP